MTLTHAPRSAPTRLLAQLALWLSLLLSPLSTPALAHQEPDLYKAAAGPYSVKTIDKDDWRDAARDNRPVPVRIYLPESPDKPKGAAGAASTEKLPVIIFSHGLGGSRSGYRYFGEHLASNGYIVIVPTHAGSDTASVVGGNRRGNEDPAAAPPHPDQSHRAFRRNKDKDKDKPKPQPADPAQPADPNGNPDSTDSTPGRTGFFAALDDPANLRNRPRDISFVIDQLTKDPLLHDRADPSRIGVAGHSFGAYTAMAIGGLEVNMPAETPKSPTTAPDAMTPPTPASKPASGAPATAPSPPAAPAATRSPAPAPQSFRDQRVKAVLPMSPEGPGTMGIGPHAWDKFAVPVFFLTGTKDYGRGQRAAEWRRAGFEHVGGVDNYLATITDATHMAFANPAGLMAGGDSRSRARFPELIDSLSTAFFDAYVKDDSAAKDWLKSYFAQTKHDALTTEFKPAKP